MGARGLEGEPGVPGTPGPRGLPVSVGIADKCTTISHSSTLCTSSGPQVPNSFDPWLLMNCCVDYLLNVNQSTFLTFSERLLFMFQF